jgi:hypothetical protein
MNHIASTMPEAKFRSTKKRTQPVRSIRSSEFAAEMKARKATVKQAHPGTLVEFPTTAKTLPEASTKKAEKAGFSIASFWPLAVGLFLTGFAPEWQSIATQAGVWVLRFTFPFALLATHREIGIDSQMATVLPQMALYAQLPIDGILMMLSFARSKSLKAAIFQVTAVHAVCAFVLWLVATGAK